MIDLYVLACCRRSTRRRCATRASTRSSTRCSSASASTCGCAWSARCRGRAGSAISASSSTSSPCASPAPCSATSSCGRAPSSTRLLSHGDALFHISPLADQSIAGAIMMVEESILTLGLFCWLFLRTAREGEERQELLDYASAARARAERGACRSRRRRRPRRRAARASGGPRRSASDARRRAGTSPPAAAGQRERAHVGATLQRCAPVARWLRPRRRAASGRGCRARTSPGSRRGACVV